MTSTIGHRDGGPSLRTRVTLLAIAGLVVLVAMATLVWAAYADVRRVGDEVTARLSPAADISADLVVAYDRVDGESGQYVLTGDADARARYVTARARVEADTLRLRPLLAPDAELAADLDRVEAAAATWLGQVVEPGVRARDAGPLSVAEIAAFLDASATGYAVVSAATTALRVAVDDARDLAFDELSSVARRLSLALALAGAVLLALVASAYVLVRRWVLTPLDELREQLQEVAREGRRDQVIVPSGPPELRAAGTDAESMRRALVAEADAARAADESLAMQGPVVAAVRADLATGTDPAAPGLVVHGELHPAEGVLAGDWWGLVALEGGRTALLVVDVSGHGPLAGLVTMRLRAVMSVALRSGFDAGTALARTATALTDHDDGRFATALVLILDPGGETLTWANAGHPAGWLLPRGSTAQRMPLGPTGPLLSALGGTWTTSTAPLGVDDVVLAWSDGLTETRDAAEELGDDALAALVDAAGTREPAELVARLLADLRDGAAEWRRDDITLVAVRRVA